MQVIVIRQHRIVNRRREQTIDYTADKLM